MAADDLDWVIGEMYDSISYERGSRPDWKRSAELFVPGARMVRINDTGLYEFGSQAEYRADFERMIETGVLPSFWEFEIWRESRIFGEMAHVLSGYEARHSREGPFHSRGVNSIQMFQRDGRWWISAMLWRREGAQVRIPTSAPG